MDNTTNLMWNNLDKNKQKHHFLLPSPSLRALIIGSSGCGKTNLLLKLLLSEKWLDYKDLYVFSKSLHQPEYKLLKVGFDKGYSKNDIKSFLLKESGDVDKFIRSLPNKGKRIIKVNYFENSESIPDPKEINCKRKSLFVFDDVMTENKQSKAEDFYTRGRHNNCSSIYISQNYHKLPRQTIRNNSNLLILFSIPKKDLQHIHEDIISNDMDFKEFMNWISDSREYSHVIINKESSQAKYLKNFNEVYLPKRYF